MLENYEKNPEISEALVKVFESYVPETKQIAKNPETSANMSSTAMEMINNSPASVTTIHQAETIAAKPLEANKLTPEAAAKYTTDIARLIKEMRTDAVAAGAISEV